MKSSSFIFILLIIRSSILKSNANTDICSGRWQLIDKLNIKITLDWQVHPKTNTFVTEFRTNLVQKGFWYGFTFSSSLNKSEIGLIYVLRWKENDTDISWDRYNLTESNITILNQNDSSSITFQRLSSSGLLTVRPRLNLTSFLIENQCLYLMYLRGRFENDQPLLPDEIHSNQSLCLTCQQEEVELTSMSTNLTTEDPTTHYILLKNSTTRPVGHIRLLSNNIPTSTSLQSSSFNSRKEYHMFWFGRIVNQSWSNDYYNLSSLSTQNLRLNLQNLFLFLINHNSSYSFICNQFEFYSLQPGSILFASNISLLSNLTENQTINAIENLIKSVNSSIDHNLYFDLSAHQVKQTNQLSHIDILFKNFSRTVDYFYPRNIEIDAALHIVVGCIIGIGCLMILITTILCLYGYYKCRRRQFRLYTEQRTFKFKHDISSYRWLGQQPSTGSSSPYLIQSTSI